MPFRDFLRKEAVFLVGKPDGREHLNHQNSALEFEIQSPPEFVATFLNNFPTDQPYVTLTVLVLW